MILVTYLNQKKAAKAKQVNGRRSGFYGSVMSAWKHNGNRSAICPRLSPGSALLPLPFVKIESCSTVNKRAVGLTDQF
jgi:hypothetical protein